MLRQRMLRAAGEAVPTFVSSSVNRSGTSPNTVTAPTGIEDGDLLVAFGANDGLARTLTSIPSGFTIIKQDATSTNTFFVATKKAASESGDYAFSWSGSGSSVIAIAVYRDAVGVLPVGALTRASSTTATAASITPSVTGTLCAAFYQENDNTVTTPPSGMTQRVLYAGDNDPTMAMYDSFAASGVATGAKTLLWSGSAQVGGIQFQVIPEAPQLEFITSASRASSDNTSTVTAPAGIEAGDLLVFTDYVPNYSSGTVPTGFTQLVLTEVAAVDHRTSYKIADGTESGTTITGMTGSDQACILAVFRGMLPAITTGTWNSEGTDGNPSPQTVTPPTDSQVLVLYAAGSRSSSAPTFTSESPAFDSTISVASSDDGLVLAYSVYQTSASEHTADVGDTASRNTFHSGYLAGV